MANKKPTCINLGYGSVYSRKTKSGILRWYRSYHSKNGERIRRVIPHAQNQQQAIQAHLEAISHEFFGEHIPSKKTISFRNWAKVYLRDYSSLNKTWKDIEYKMKPLTEFFNDKELRQIAPSDIQRFIKSRQIIGNSPATLNRYISLVKRVVNVAIQEGFLETNPVKIKKFSEQDREKTRVISEEEEAVILENSSPQLKSFLIIALNTGMRAGEIYRMSYKQISLQDRMITVEMTKSGKVRCVPINEGLFQELLRMRSGNAKSQYLFYNSKTRKPITSMKKAFAGALERSNLSGIRIHDFRHTAATRWIRSGVDVQTVKELLGHSDISITQRYLHSDAEAKRRAVDTLDSELRMKSQWHTGDTRRKGKDNQNFPNPFFSVN